LLGDQTQGEHSNGDHFVSHFLLVKERQIYSNSNNSTIEKKRIE